MLPRKGCFLILPDVIVAVKYCQSVPPIHPLNRPIRSIFGPFPSLLRAATDRFTCQHKLRRILRRSEKTAKIPAFFALLESHVLRFLPIKTLVSPGFFYSWTAVTRSERV